MRCAKPFTRAILPTLASPVRIGFVLAPSHQHIDDLTDLVVAAKHRIKNRIDVAGFRLGG
jgi:hypothetical protein